MEKGSNRTFWCNKEYDELLKKALKTTNISKRKSYYAQAMTIINEEMPLLAIAHSKRFQARGTNVKGDILEDFGGISFYDVYKNNEVSDTNEIVAPNKEDKVID
jgi:cationic peptide transport system substrate-binding protein